MSATAIAQAPERSGKEVVEASCATCHRGGTGRAPQIGDRAAWAKRASAGVDGLTQSALKGIRAMPPHGSTLLFTDAEIKAAVVYMLQETKQHSTEPISH